MNYNYICKTRAKKINRFFNDKNTRYLCQTNHKYFTRDRKLPFTDVLMITYNKQAKTTSMEIRNYEKKVKGNNKVNYSEEAYLKQRRHLNPKVFKEALKIYVSDFYQENKQYIKKYKGYLLMAIDGSKIEVPNTPQNREYFGTPSTQYERQPARALTSTIYDINNHFYVDSEIDQYKTSEIKLAKKNIEKALEIVDDKMIVIFDRNYPSLDMINWLIEHNIYFIIRLTENYYKKERESMQGNDELISIQHTKSRINTIKLRDEEIAKQLEKKEYTNVRCTNIELPTGQEETLISNLSFEEFDSNEIKKLYSKRWKIEVSYNTLKNKLKLEVFTGKLPIIIEQDYYVQILIYNQIQDMIRCADELLEEKNKNKKTKYKYRINENKAIGLFKDEYIKILLIKDNKRSQQLFDSLINEMQNYVTAIREGRKTQPRLATLHNRNHSNLKPSF